MEIEEREERTNGGMVVKRCVCAEGTMNGRGRCRHQARPNSRVVSRQLTTTTRPSNPPSLTACCPIPIHSFNLRRTILLASSLVCPNKDRKRASFVLATLCLCCGCIVHHHHLPIYHHRMHLSSLPLSLLLFIHSTADNDRHPHTTTITKRRSVDDEE